MLNSILIILSITFTANLCQPQTSFGNVNIIDISFSEKLDAATFLNAISDDPRFYLPWKDLRDVWIQKLYGEPETFSLIKPWMGKGIQLAYILSILPENDIDGVLNRLKDPLHTMEIISEGLDEPAYLDIFNDFRINYREVERFLIFLKKNNFSELREVKYSNLLQSTRTSLERNLAKINQSAFLNYLKIFSGSKITDDKLKIYVLLFSKPLSFQLAGFAVGWASETDYWSWLLAHEFLHKFNPAKDNIKHLMNLAESDPFYRKAYERIYDEFDEGLEEEFVDAGARYIVHQMGIMPYIRNLRSLKFMYRSETTGEAGMPIAGILFDALVNIGSIDENFNYNAFIRTALEETLLKTEKIEKRYQEVLKPVSGTIGMILKTHESGAIVDRIFPNYPAERSGIIAGDVILETDNIELIGKPLEDILDLLAGEKKSSKHLTINRNGAVLKIVIQLQ